MDTSLHSASTASEISERLQDEADGSSTKYEEGQFESDEGRESAEESASAPSRGGSSSGEYASDTFEDDQEAVDTVAALDTAAASDAEGENDYGSDSFEQEDDQQVARTRQSTLHTDICDSQRPDELDNVHGKIQSAQDHDIEKDESCEQISSADIENKPPRNGSEAVDTSGGFLPQPALAAAKTEHKAALS
ncbi:hypothetical protein PHYBOEH_010120 [Phytophthora boehmeriae]|uniref:Uncharacterized protein n=1 Tax=Phytophthora boehmeriae TaxID=109152 RepID=A0A8T1WXU0_9STRA|nr:hypothetical protein PHYBOEH_010120 [Phytophthora boehmeriae]